MNTRFLVALIIVLVGTISAQNGDGAATYKANAPDGGKILLIFEATGQKRMVISGTSSPYAIDWIESDDMPDQLWQIEDSLEYYGWQQIRNMKYDCYLKQDQDSFTCETQDRNTVLYGRTIWKFNERGDLYEPQNYFHTDTYSFQALDGKTSYRLINQFDSITDFHVADMEKNFLPLEIQSTYTLKIGFTKETSYTYLVHPEFRKTFNDSYMEGLYLLNIPDEVKEEIKTSVT